MSSSNSRPPLSRPPTSSSSSPVSWPEGMTANSVAGTAFVGVACLYAVMYAWTRIEDRRKIKRNEQIREQLIEEIFAAPSATTEDKAGAGSSEPAGSVSGGGGGAHTVGGGGGAALGGKAKKKSKTSKTGSSLHPTDSGDSSQRSRSPSVTKPQRLPSGGGPASGSVSPKQALHPSLSPSSTPANASSSTQERRSSVASTSPIPHASDKLSILSIAPSAGPSATPTSKLISASAPVPLPLSADAQLDSAASSTPEGDFQLVGPAGRAATKLTKKAAKKAAAAAAAAQSGTARGPPAKPTQTTSTSTSAAPSTSTAAEKESGVAALTLVVQPPSPRASDPPAVTTQTAAAPLSSHPPAPSLSTSSEWDWDPATRSTNAVASSSSATSSVVDAAEAAALKTAFSTAQTEIERLQFELAEAREASRVERQRKDKEWGRKEREVRIKVADEERRKWEAWEGDRRGRETQLQYQLHHLSLQHASLVHHARAMENVLRELNHNHPIAAPMSGSLLPTPTTSPTATMRRGGAGGGGRRSPFPNGTGQPQQHPHHRGGGGPNANGAFLGVQGGMGLNGAGGQGKEGGGQWGEAVEVDQSVMFTVLKNPPPASLDQKPREGSVDSGTSSSHSSTGGGIDPTGLLSRSPPELVFASIASYDMNSTPIRPPSSNTSHHHLGGGGGSSIGGLSYTPSVIGSSSASASSGSSLGSPAGELAALAGEEERGRHGARGWDREESARKGGLVFGTVGQDVEPEPDETVKPVKPEPEAEKDDQPDTPLFASILRPPSSEVY